MAPACVHCAARAGRRRSLWCAAHGEMLFGCCRLALRAPLSRSRARALSLARSLAFAFSFFFSLSLTRSLTRSLARSLAFSSPLTLSLSLVGADAVKFYKYAIQTARKLDYVEVEALLKSEQSPDSTESPRQFAERLSLDLEKQGLQQATEAMAQKKTKKKREKTEKRQKTEETEERRSKAEL